MTANEDDGLPVSYDSLRGKWEVVGSEIENPENLAELYHFSQNEFWWELHFAGGQKSIQRFNYRIEEGLIRFKSRNAKVPWSLVAFHVGEMLVFRPEHGMETWMKNVGEFGDLTALEDGILRRNCLP